MATYYTGSMAKRDRRMNRRTAVATISPEEQARMKAAREREEARQAAVCASLIESINRGYDEALVAFKAARAADPSLVVKASTFNGVRYLWLVSADEAVSLSYTTSLNPVSRFDLTSPGLGEGAWSLSSALYTFHQRLAAFRAKPVNFSRGFWGPYDYAEALS